MLIEYYAPWYYLNYKFDKPWKFYFVNVRDGSSKLEDPYDMVFQGHVKR